LNLLIFGSSQAGTLAKQSEIARPHVYEILERLVARGLVSVHEKNGVKHFSALSLDELLLLFQRKELALANKRKQLVDVITSLQQSESNFCADPKTKSYSGAEAHARLFQELNRECTDPGIVFCSADKSSLFEGLTPTKQQLFQLSQMLPVTLKVVLFSTNPETLERVADLNLPNLIPYAAQFPIELIVQSERVTLIGEKGSTPYAITIEQAGLAECFRMICEPVLQRCSGDLNIMKEVA
jgi:sugar-specific transcriptional regulator TrmB